MNQSFLLALTKAVNAYLHLDPESATRIQNLQGKIIAFELLPFHFTFQCVFDEKQMNIVSEKNKLAEATLRGTPLQMLGAALIKEERQHFFADDLIIEGNAELAFEVIALFDEIDIDWEEYFSHYIGDQPAYHFHRTVKKIKNWLQSSHNTFLQNTNEYLHEEKNWFPTKEALRDFFADIDSLRLDVDRIAARINKLQEQKDK